MMLSRCLSSQVRRKSDAISKNARTLHVTHQRADKSANINHLRFSSKRSHNVPEQCMGWRVSNRRSLSYQSSNTSRTCKNGRESSSLAVEDNEMEMEDLNGANDEMSSREPWMVNLKGTDEEWLTGPRTADWFTGVSPEQCPGANKNGKLQSLPLPNLSKVTRESTLEYFDNTWTLMEILFAGFNGEEGFYRPPGHGLRHPQIFYYGHTPCLYINKLRVAGVLSKAVNPYFESIFEVGVDEMLWDDMHKNEMVWPSVSEVHAYRKEVYATVRNVIQTHESFGFDGSPVEVNQDHPLWALFMGFEHERIHFETSSVLFRETPQHFMQLPHNWPPSHPSSKKPSPTSSPTEGVHYPKNHLISVSTSDAKVELGKPNDFPSFGWDNEYGHRSVQVPPFAASEYMVTNGEFWQFVSDGGYRNKENWCEDSWAWRSHRNMKWPFFWEQAGPAGSNEYELRTIFDRIPMQWDWPVDVNYYEAKAFCRWKSQKDNSPSSIPYRLITEAEHHLIRNKKHNIDAARSCPSSDKVMETSGSEFPNGPTGANLNLAFTSQNPVTFFPPSQTGHHDTAGNSWEWTEDHFNPLNGFGAHPTYDDFSVPCFDGKHSMIVGGSFISTGDEASVFARFHFRPHFLQHSGFRLVVSDKEAPATHLFPGDFSGQVAARDGQLDTVLENEANSSDANVYDTEELVHMYLGLHYPTSGVSEGIAPILDHANCPNHGLRFPQRVAELLCSLNPKRTNGKVLDIGCSVGGTSFELAKSFQHVDAFDFSKPFIEAARKMQNEESVSFRIPIETDIYNEVQAIHEPDIDGAVLKKVNFFVGDATQIKKYVNDKIIDTYDGVVMSNLLCRLPDPIACLDSLPHVVNKGGVVVMVTPFSWLEQFTPRGKWLGGFYDPVTKKPLYSKDCLEELMMERGFEKIHEEEMPLVIREHQRKYQYIVSEATGWRRL